MKVVKKVTYIAESW